MRPDAQPWWMGAAAFSGAMLARTLGATWRIDQQDHPDYVTAERAGERFLYCFWHARLFPLVYSHRGEGIAVLVSQHRDGEIIARIVETMGFATARGSSTRGGDAGVREMLRHARAGRQLAITPDGPRGPAEQLKDGLVYLAARLQRRIVPIATASDSAWAARSWDRFRIPYPFARVCISHGAPIAVPPRPGDADAAAAHAELERTLRTLTQQVRERAKEAA